MLAPAGILALAQGELRQIAIGVDTAGRPAGTYLSNFVWETIELAKEITTLPVTLQILCP